MGTKEIFIRPNLIIMGLDGTLQQLYTSLVKLYNDAALETNRASLSFIDRVEKKCHEDSIKMLDRFVSRYTHFFVADKLSLRIEDQDPNPFSMFEIKKSEKRLCIEVSIITYMQFLDRLYDYIVRLVLIRRRSDKPRTTYESVEEEITERFQAILNQYRKRVAVECIDDSLVDQDDLFVYTNFAALSCNLKQHIIVPDEYVAKMKNAVGFVNMSIHRCRTCGRRFIGRYTLSFYEQEYGKLEVRCRKDSEQSGINSFDGIGFETKLHSEGYSVAANKLTEKERRDLLIRLLESDRMSYFEIVRDIKTAINTQKHLPSRAYHVEKWKNDLDFLREYVQSRGTELRSLAHEEE